jgi:hypothetical protein
MRKLIAACALVLAMAIGSSAFAEEAEAAAAVDTAAASDDGGAFQPFVLGAFISMGAALTVGDLGGDTPKPRFAGSGGAYFDYYLNEMFALEGGLGFIGKGYRLAYTDADGFDIKARQTFIDLEIPLGAKLNIKNFQASVAVAIDFVVSGKTRSKFKDGNTTTETTSKLSGNDWNDIRRFNIGPKVGLGYAIALGPVFLVPGLSWSMDLIDWTKPSDLKARGMNIMVVVGGEWGFGGE